MNVQIDFSHLKSSPRTAPGWLRPEVWDFHRLPLLASCSGLPETVSALAVLSEDSRKVSLFLFSNHELPVRLMLQAPGESWKVTGTGESDGCKAKGTLPGGWKHTPLMPSPMPYEILLLPGKVRMLQLTNMASHEAP
jgi:hypothetical protein